MMWLCLESGAADDAGYWRRKAEEYSRGLEGRKEDRDVHDLGFIFYHGTFKRWYEATVREGRPLEELKDAVVRAGQVLALRFKPNGQYLRSFISDESLFIDIMMNVGVTFYAAREMEKAAALAAATAQSREGLNAHELRRRGMQHCLTTMRTLIRGDGSTAHEGIFDLTTGEFLRQTTHQGYRGDSCWSRGLAWSLYGFGTCYELTGDRRFLNAAELNAEFYLMNTATGVVPPWDYDAPLDGRLSVTQPDSSAAAIAAVGLFNLARMTGDRVRAQAYEAAAMGAVETLCGPGFLAEGDAGWEGILKRGVYHIHKGLGVDESVMWGEFFFVEALVKALEVL
jgi:unsaturated chondroitin disaccharide hydrolase